MFNVIMASSNKFGKESPFGKREWVSAKDIASVYGLKEDFYRKLAKQGAIEDRHPLNCWLDGWPSEGKRFSFFYFHDL